MSKYFIGSYETDEQALRQIERLKDEGYSESDMYVMTQHEDQLTMIKGKTNVDNYAEEGNWLDRFTSFLSGDKQTELAFRTMQLSKAEEEKYYNDLKAGRVLLYVNQDYEGRFREAGGDSFKLGEKDKAELHNRKEESETAPPAGIDEEETVELDDHHYADE
ncbi:general stress protein [Planococcus sp. CAU13]|uniref:general stress protein n=1 Tax=Planococcus sp. CAU13 TaxID=1541197 RepID=UPI0006923A36|nr:general stress protein [Planococcus sp. CAU13]